jgi:hypothetical protein
MVMPDTFAIHLPPDHAYTRRMLFAVEVVDAVTLDPLTRGIEVKAEGLAQKPRINSGGFFVFLQEGGAVPLSVTVDASKTGSESVTVAPPVAPDRSIRVELAPRVDYPFVPGVTAMRGSLVESALADPATPVGGAELWLQWLDDVTAAWVDAPTRSHSDARGNFAALLRLTPSQVSRPIDGRTVRSRLRVRRAGVTRTSAEISLPTGRVADALPPFGWSELVP